MIAVEPGDDGDAVRRSAEDYLDLRYLKYFSVVAESGSFTRAAERLNTVQPSISRQIKRLEDIVGTALFVRGPHDLTLTPAGTVFLQEARLLLRQAQRAIGRAREAGEPAAALVAGVVPGVEPLLFQHVLTRVRAGCPDLPVAIRSMSEREQLARLRDGQIDLAFLSGPVDEPDLHSSAAVWLPFVIALSERHPLAGRASLRLEDLAPFALIRPDPTSAPYYNIAVSRAAAAAGVSYDMALTTCESPLSALQMVASSTGFCFVVDCQAEYAPSGTVVRPIDMAEPPGTTLHLVRLHDGGRRHTERFIAAFQAGAAAA